MLWSIAVVSASCARSGSNLIQSSSILIHAFRATPSWSPSEWQSPTGAAAGLNCQQHRNRTTFTSNVMGEYRSKRISDHFTYMRKLKVWRGQMASQLAIWRGGFRKVQFEQWEEKRKQEVISTAADAANHAHRLAEKQHEELMETIRKVTNEHAVVSLSTDSMCCKLCGARADLNLYTHFLEY